MAYLQASVDAVLGHGKACRCRHPSTSVHVWLQALLATTFLALSCAQILKLPRSDIDITSPLRICTASINNFGLRCDGGPPELAASQRPDGLSHATDSCPGDERFCGHDIDVWREVAKRLDLVEGRDFEHVCLGQGGFEYMLSSLAGEDATYGVCDMGVSAITVSSKRKARGITFSTATHDAHLAIMVHARLKELGPWGFFNPLHWHVWLALVVTVIATPILVFFFESVFNKGTFYAKDGKIDIPRGLRECMWHSVCHTLSIDVFRVRSFSARIVVVAYAFLVLIITHTYTANLAAFLTVHVLGGSMGSIEDLKGKAVATVAPYVSRLDQNHAIEGSTVDGWDYGTMVAKLKEGRYAAIISDDTQLKPRAYADSSCSLHLLPVEVEPFDLAFAFRRGFPNDTLREDVSNALLAMQEDSTLSDIKEQHLPKPPDCLSRVTEYDERTQVGFMSVWGLWIIMAVAVGLAIMSGAIEYAIKRRMNDKDAADKPDDAADKHGNAANNMRDQLTSGNARYDAGQRDQAAQHAVHTICGLPAAQACAVTTLLAGHGTPAGPAGQAGGDPGRDLYRSGRTSVGRGSGAGRHRSGARQRMSSTNSSLADSLHPSIITEYCEQDDGAMLADNLSMHSMPANGDPADASLSEGSGHGTAGAATAIVPPPPPPGFTDVVAQHAQHAGDGEASAVLSAAAQAREFRSELSDVMSMLRMVTQRVEDLRRTGQVHV
eukprot:jgi/Ulvmu1/6788/UM030_0126.1